MKRFFIAIIMLPFIWNCTPDGEQINAVEAEQNVSLQLSPMAKVFENETVLDFVVPDKSSGEHFKNENSNGVMFIESGADVVLLVQDFPYLLAIYHEGLLSGGTQSLIDVKIFSEDRAQFFSNAKNPAVEVYDMRLFTGTFWDIMVYSNLCRSNRKGNIHINITGPYIETIDPTFGFNILQPVFSDAETANNLQLTTWVDDGTFFNNEIEYFNFIYQCIPMNQVSDAKRLHATSLFKQNGGSNISIKGL